MQFCRISRGSVSELIDDFNACLDENYGAIDHVELLKNDAYAMMQRINGYITYLRNSGQK